MQYDIGTCTFFGISFGIIGDFLEAGIIGKI